MMKSKKTSLLKEQEELLYRMAADAAAGEDAQELDSLTAEYSDEEKERYWQSFQPYAKKGFAYIKKEQRRRQTVKILRVAAVVALGQN